MEIFSSTLNQIAFLFGFIALGYILAKLKALPENAATVLSKLENNVFIPGLVLGTFIENFTVERISAAKTLLLVSIVAGLVAIVFAILVSKLVTKDTYIQKIYTYGLSFSNFGFMGNAVVSTLFPDIFFEYLIFTLPLWTFIYLWGVPRLLITDSSKTHTFKDNLRSFVNPMFICMVIGMIIGLAKIPVFDWMSKIIKISGDCMSPIAMILTGIVVSSVSLKRTFTNVGVYIISIVRLVVIPLIFIFVSKFISFEETIFICTICSLSMPLGLNTIVVPSAYGKDTTVAASMAIISHIMSCVTIPLIFMMI